MPTYTFSAIAIADITTSAWGFNTVDGSQFTPGTTITIAPDAAIDTLSVEDDDLFLDDDDPSQSFTAGQVLQGSTLPAGIQIENEYTVTVQDSLGNVYRMIAISAENDAWKIHGFAFVPSMPPFGEALTVVSAADVQQGIDPYTSLAGYAPACFTAGTLIATPQGDRPVERLRAGQTVLTLDAGPERIGMILRQELRLAEGPSDHRPVRFAPGDLGPGLPDRALCISPQHRLLMRDDRSREWLVPAKAFAPPEPGPEQTIQYLHIVLPAHRIIRANGVWTESFWPGSEALAGLTERQRAHVARLMPQPEPARPFLPPGAARRHPGPLTAPATAGEGRLLSAPSPSRRSHRQSPPRPRSPDGPPPLSAGSFRFR